MKAYGNWTGTRARKSHHHHHSSGLPPYKGPTGGQLGSEGELGGSGDSGVSHNQLSSKAALYVFGEKSQIKVSPLVREPQSNLIATEWNVQNGNLKRNSQVAD